MERILSIKFPDVLIKPNNIPWEMYRIPSQLLPISDRAKKRYIDCQQQNQLIIKKSFDNSKLNQFIPSVYQNNSERELVSSINQDLNSDDVNVQLEASKRIIFVLEKEQTILKKRLVPLAKKALNSYNVENQVKGAELIWYTPNKNKNRLKKKVVPLAKHAIKSDDIGVQLKGVEMIGWAPEDKKASLINLALNSKNVEVQIKGVEAIIFASEEEAFSLINKALKSKNVKVRVQGAKMIRCTTGKEVVILIDKALDDDDVKVQAEGSKMIQHVLKEDQISLEKKLILSIKQALSSNDINIQAKGIEMIECVSTKEEKDNLFLFALSKGLGNVLIESSLYKRNNLSDTYFERQNFEKFGSETTLIGGSLKGKTIIRHIEPKAFLAWQKTYEDYQTWKEAGFDYVPIEPIIKYNYNGKTKLVDVFSGVLDLNLAHWQKLSTWYGQELAKQSEKIENVLNSEKVNHGHIHDSNYVLCFYRHENGSVDFSKAPRLYLIDFDQATSY